MNEERFGFISSTDDGNAMFADIPSEAVSLSCRYGQITLFDNDRHPRDTRRERSVIDGGDIEDGLARTNIAPGEEDVISLELNSASSDDQLLLKPASP